MINSFVNKINMENKIFTLEDMDEEYIKGARNILNFLREEGIICRPIDNCSECRKVDSFFKKRKKEVKNG